MTAGARSHPVAAVLEVGQTPAPGVRRVRVRLRCGCELERDVPEDRVIAVEGGALVVGKLPCPAGHLVAPR